MERCSRQSPERVRRELSGPNPGSQFILIPRSCSSADTGCDRLPVSAMQSSTFGPGDVVSASTIGHIAAVASTFSATSYARAAEVAAPGVFPVTGVAVTCGVVEGVTVTRAVAVTVTVAVIWPIEPGFGGRIPVPPGIVVAVTVAVAVRVTVGVIVV